MQAKQKVPAQYPRLMLAVSGKDREGLEKKKQKHFIQAELPEKFMQRKKK